MTITKEEWNEFNKHSTRNYTDGPIGATTDGKRQADAMASEIFHDGDSLIPVFDKTDKEGRAA